MTGSVGTLYSVVLTLSPTQPAAVPATAGHQAHAAFLATLREVDPPLAEALHAPGVPVRPFTVSPLLGVGPARNGWVSLSATHDYYLRFTVLYAPIYERFMVHFLRGEGRPVIRLGGAELLVKEIRTSPGSHPWAGYSSWEELACRARPGPEVTLEFASPSAFSFGQQAWGKKIIVLPEPRLVFGSLVRSWNRLAPAPLQVDARALDSYLEEHVVVKRVADLSTQMLRFAKSPQVGFVGQVTFGLMADNDIARLQLNMLADFAFYSGVGMKTTMGMGQCRRVGTEDQGQT